MAPPMVTLIQKWWQGLALDLRSLALLRIAYGCLLLLDLGIRATDLKAHYSDQGCCPGELALKWTWATGFWSLHLIQGHWLGQGLLFLLTAAAYVCLTVGYRTRAAGWLSWILLVSMQNRDQMVLDGGDLYLRCLIFWLLFCPWGARWSVDAARAGNSQDKGVWTMGAAAYCWQLTLIYAFAYLLKTGHEWTVDGTAVQTALMLDQIISPPAHWLLGKPDLMHFLNFAVLYFEGLAALLIWIHPATRLLAVLGLTGMHLGLGSFMHLGVFAPVAAVSSWALIPGWVWERWPRPGWSFHGRWPWPGFQDPGLRPASTVLNVLLLFLMMRVTYCNIYWARYHRVPDRAADLRLLRLDQQWNMFAPRPLPDDGYYVVVGETDQGNWVNLWLTGGEELSWDKPARVASMYPNARWRKFMMNVFMPENRVWSKPLLEYLGRRWQQMHPGQVLRGMRLYFVLEKSLTDGTEAPLQVQLLDYRAWHEVADREAPSAYATLSSGLGVLNSLSGRESTNSGK